MQKSFGLGGCIFQNRYIIGVVGVDNCFCGVPVASFLCQLETVFFDFIDRCSKHVVKTDDKEVWAQCVSLQYPSLNVEVVCVSIRRTHFHFGVSIETFVKSTNNIAACMVFFLAHTRSRILWIVNICEVLDLFLLKPLWFFLRMLSILGSMRLRSRAFYILAGMVVSVIPR